MFEKSKLIEFLRSLINIWNILRFSLILVCFGWFCYNAISIVSSYMEYNTIVMIEFKQPNETDLPAFTVCSYSFIYDEDLSITYWEDWQDFLNKNNTSPNDKYGPYLMRQAMRDKALDELTAQQIFDDQSITFENMVAQCNFFTKSNHNISEVISCNKIVPVIESIIHGRKCFTIFNQMNITEDNYVKKKLEYEMNPYIQIVLANQSAPTLGEHLNNETSIFTIHSPNIIPTGLDVKYYIILGGSTYFDVRFTKQISHLLEYPYKTMCRWYSRDNVPGQKSRGDCLNHCINQKTYDKCYSFFSVITRDMLNEKRSEKICAKSKSNYLKYANARRDCMKDCKLTCHEEGIEIAYADYYMNNDPTNYIEIRSDTDPYTIVYHEESMGEAELIGNLGGHAHIWLGLSALKIFNGIVHLVNRIKRLF